MVDFRAINDIFGFNVWYGLKLSRDNAYADEGFKFQ